MPVPLISAEDAVVVIIDTQPGFLQKLEPARADEIVDRIRWLTRFALALEVPIVVTEEEPDRNGGTVEAVDALISPDVVRHTKPAFGLASCPPIMADLERHARRTSVLCGLETDVCVAQSAIGLVDGGWRTAVVMDAVASPGEAHAQGLARMASAGAVLVGLKGLAYEWLRTVADANAHDDLLAHPPLGIVL
ncbi:MAG: isochorismatase family protein [Actinomycetota bacterium]|nr:isochorismatase family protein [Actinomycetota bacterium]